jgi:hypothetical protein
MAGHQVLGYANELAAKLAARSRHVCLFLGAGSSRACGLPDITGLTEHIQTNLEGDQASAFASQIQNRNLEQVLSRLRRIAALLAGDTGQVDGLTADAANDLDRAICRLIVEAVTTENADITPALRLAAWTARADYHLPVEVFTVNYDLLIETALDSLGVPYFDGFTGSLRARFRTDLVEAGPNEAGWLPSFFVRLWKLHGSVNWLWDQVPRAEVVRLGAPVPNDEPAAVYPSDAKYDESRRVPFIVLQDRFRRALHHQESLLLISGYSFGDAHLNEMIFDAAMRRPRSEFVALCYGDIPHDLIERALVTPNLQALGATEAVIGATRDVWTPPDEAPAELWHDDKFGLGSFSNLATFLARSSPPQGDLEARLAELLAKAAEAAGA